MRMEDLDTGRVRPGLAAQQLADLAAVGVDWDGEVVVQSERLGLYEEALGVLRAERRLYECFCTRAEIREAASAAHGPLPEGAYPGTCLRLSGAELAEKRASGRPPALRVRADGASVAFEDRLLGRIEGVVDDFVVRRGDGAFAYNLAVVVDDADAGRRGGRARLRPRRLHPAPALARAGARAAGARPCARAARARARRRAPRQAPRRRDAARAAACRRAGLDGGLAGLRGPGSAGPGCAAVRPGPPAPTRRRRSLRSSSAAR